VNKIQKEFEIAESKLSGEESAEAAKKEEELAKLEENFKTNTTDST
jgi:hypothetical protein